MYTQAYFENIQEQISKELISAKTSIHIAVAWFTDKELFRQLCNKVSGGVGVELLLMDDEINQNSGIDYRTLIAPLGKLWLIKPDDDNRLMHNKFCIIDNETIINGSYNWTKKAKHNHESITIIKDSPDLALQFLDEFNKLKKTYFGIELENLILDYNKLIIRLDTLKNAILLSDNEDINQQISKIRIAIKNVKDDNIAVIPDILQSAIEHRFSDAVKLINDFSTKFRSLIIYLDEELSALKLEARALEIQISTLEDELIEIEKQIHDFEVAYNKELGELILRILDLRREKFRKTAEKDSSTKHLFEESEKDFNEFNSNYESVKLEKRIQLSDEDKSELKEKFRKASKLCHPDVVSDHFKEEAEKIFISLKEAYDNNDLEKIRSILYNLENGIFINKSIELKEKDKLKSLVVFLKHKRIELEQSIENLRKSGSYIEISSIDDLNSYLFEKKSCFLNELSKLIEDE
jgi:hypothetical protein